jgi:hypothetical protein
VLNWLKVTADADFAEISVKSHSISSERAIRQFKTEQGELVSVFAKRDYNEVPSLQCQYRLLNWETLKLSLELDGLGNKVSLNHESNLECDSVVKFTKVKTCELFDFFKTVNKCVTVNKKLS